MKILPLCLLALALAGCGTTHPLALNIGSVDTTNGTFKPAVPVFQFAMPLFRAPPPTARMALGGPRR